MLAEIDDLKAYLGFTDVTSEDDTLDLIIVGADAWVRTYCGREFESRRRTLRVDATDYYTCWVPDMPLTQVYAVTAFTSVIDTVGLPVDLTRVRFYQKGMIWSEQALFVPSVPNSVLVDYTAGYEANATELKTLKWVCLEVAAQMYRNRGIFNLDDYNAGGVQYQKYSSDIWPLLGPEVMAILASFRSVGPREDL
jgi:uncharacterized phiE125 gp8 family phage protein